MGNAAASLRSAGQQQAKRKLPSAPSPAPADPDVLNRIAAQEQARMRDLPAMEEMQSKDMPLDQLLSHISSAVKPRAIDLKHSQGPDQPGLQGEAHEVETGSPGQGVVDPTSGGPQRSGTAVMMSAKDRRQPIPEYKPSGLTVDQLAQLQGRQSAAGRKGMMDDADPGRLQAYVLREVLEAKNAAEAQGQPLDLTPFTQAYGAKAEQLNALFKYCAIPVVGRIKTFGHEYGFARPPAWWLPKNESMGAMFRSEAAVLEDTKATEAAASITDGSGPNAQPAQLPPTKKTAA